MLLVCGSVGLMKVREMDLAPLSDHPRDTYSRPSAQQSSPQPWSYGNQMSKGPLGINQGSLLLADCHS